jgi:hypothetical protein
MKKPTSINVNVPRTRPTEIRNEPGTRGPQTGNIPRIGATPPPKKS